MMVVVVVVMVVVGKRHVRIASFRGSSTRGLRGVRSHQEGKRIRDGIKELGIRTRRW